MILLPAIDLYGGQAVRLYKGDYSQMTVYDKEPIRAAVKMELQGATHLHLVDLEGAKTGQTPHLPVIRNIVNNSRLFVEVGGGIRSLETIEGYLNAGARRVILGTAAVQAPEFAAQAIRAFGEAIAIGVDIKDGMVATHGWTQTSTFSCEDFCRRMQDAGVATIICTDISRDGAMRGANLELYRQLHATYDVDIIASGGVSNLEDIRALRDAGIHGAIIGTAYYTGAIQLPEALRLAGRETP
jgi:phosphoribosylformimino-5-aminoimidazole carboxamide ribotide isomerase